MEFRVLGPVEVIDGDRLLEVAPAQRRHVVAALAVDAGRPVTAETLIDRVWDKAPPSARQTLYAHISRIRRLLEQTGPPDRNPVRLVRRSGGYLLDVDPERVDLHRFRRLLGRARDTSVTDGERAGLLAAALGLWQGEPLAGLPGHWAARSRQGWTQQRLDAAVIWARVEIGNGNAERVIGALTELAAANPLAEPLIAALMRALHAAGRQADALRLYDDMRRTLAEQLGADPSAEAQETHRTVLRAPAGAAEPRSVATRSVPARLVPAQLPADVPAFTGRGPELAELDVFLGETETARTGSREPTAVVISAVAGTAGVGKTALALHWAHRTRARFPDGQLYVNLRGYDPDQPMTATDALARFLTALGVPGPDIPPDVDDRAASYRTQIAGRRMLIVLDNASTVEQIRPLLPGTSGCKVLVTSRDSLAGLVAMHGAHRLDLDLLPTADAIALLHRLIGPRAGAEPEATRTLADQCARLPLALRVAAELAATRPTTPLAELVAELADQRRRLDVLDAGGDPRAAVAAVFSWSVRHLPPEAARTFGLLGLHPGPDLDAYAAAALAATSPEQARRALDRLTRAHLIHPTGPGRYGMHDLLRAYATSLSTAGHDDRDRLFDYYLATAAAAMNTLYPAETKRRPQVPPAATAIPVVTDPDTAKAWLDAERPCLTAIAAQGRLSHAMYLSGVLFRYLDGGHHAEGLTIHAHASDAAEQLGDVAEQARAQVNLGFTHFRLGRYLSAAEHLQRGLLLFRQAGDPVGQASALTCLGNVEARLGRYRMAAGRHEEALALVREAGDSVAEAFTLGNLGLIETRLGQYGAAAMHHEQSLALHRAADDQYGEALALNNLGYAEAWLGRYGPAARHHREALALFSQMGQRIGEAWALHNLGTVHSRLGKPGPATEYQLQAIAHFRDCGDLEGEAWALNGLGEAAYTAGNPGEALTHHTSALTLAIEIASHDQQARAHTGLSHAYHALGEHAYARQHYDEALARYTDLGMPDAHLAYLPQGPTDSSAPDDRSESRATT